MWTTILYFTLVGLVTAEYGWKHGTLYRYEIRGRSVAGMHQVANQFSGVLLKGKLTVQPKSDDTLTLQVHNFEQAEVHTNFSNGWSTYVKDHDVNYKPLPVSDKPFELKFKNGVVDEMYVDKTLPTWEVNVLKAIASQLQVDTQGENLKKSKTNHVPVESETVGVYKTIEDSVTGECETIYDISPLPQFVLQSRPELVPLPKLVAGGQVLDIVKTKNYSNCEQRMAYHFGLTGLTDWEPASNQMGTFLSRSSVSRIVVSGTLKSYTIQSSVTTNKIVLAPHLYNNQKGIVASRMNLTLEAVTSSSGTPQPVPNPRTVKNLVYEYNAATNDENTQHHHHMRYTQSDAPLKFKTSSESSSESSSSSSEEGLHGNKRMNIGMIRSRRSLEPRQMNREENGSSSSSESSSSDDSGSTSTSSSEYFWQPKPTLTEAPNSPFMPYFIGYLGNTIQASSKVNGVLTVYKLAKEIGEQFVYGNGITGENTLSKFNVLVSVLHTMNVTQLQEATEKLYYPYSKVVQTSEGDDQQYQAWVTFRDAVAQVGTGPALLTIKQWILSHKVSGAEAAHVVGVLPDTAHYPTTEYINTFFELVKSEEVQKQRYLNVSAVTAFTNLVRKAQVNRETAHNRYPVHSFGDLTPKNDKVVSEQYVTYLETQLRKAVQLGDSPTVQVYIRALGNVAHPKVLAVFEPFLEGHEQVSDFQRLAMVASLDKMTKVYPKLVRSVLFKIYQNSGEAPEVRVAAVMQIMKTNPPAQTLQRMAQHTNYDHSRQVSAAVKSAIESAASLHGPKSYQLAQNAKAAVHLLTTQEFGLHQSHNFIRDYVVKEEELMYKTHFAYIQGEDSVVPSSAFYTVWRSLGGYKRQPYEVSWLTSNAGSLLDLLYDQFVDVGHSGKPVHGNAEPVVGDWTFEKIGKLLNIETDYLDQVEGNFLVSLFGTKSFFAFDNHTVEQLPEYVKYVARQLRSGKHFNYNKVYNKHALQVGFPTATGLPFFYSFSTPTRVHFAGELKVVTHPELEGESGDYVPLPKTAGISGTFNAMYTSYTEGVLGFTTPYNHKNYVAVLGNNVHVGAPFKAAVEFDFEKSKFQAKVQPLEQNTHKKLFEYSTVAYTSKHEILDLKPIAEGDNTEEVHVRPVQRFETTVGQAETGFAFDVKAESEQKFWDWATVYNAATKHDGFSSLLFPLYEVTINNYNYTVTYNPQESTAKYVKLFFTYEDLFKTGETGTRASLNKHRDSSVAGGDNDAIPSSTTPANEQRQKEFLQRAVEGIKDSYARLVDVGVQFEGQTKAEYVTTAAYSTSSVDPKSRFLFFFGTQPARTTHYTKPYQVALHVNTEVPNVPLTDFVKAFQANPTSHVTAKLYFGENVNSGGKVYVQGTLKQSESRRHYLEHHPLTALCKRQMAEGNYLLPACRNATASANYFDQYKFTFNYEGVPDFVKHYLYKGYTVVRYFANHYVTENFVTTTGKESQLDVGVRFTNDLSAVNVSVETPVLYTEFTNLYVEDWVAPLVVVHPEYDFFDRFGQEVFRAQQYPTCVVDTHQATTFDNTSYPVQVGKCWHAMLHPVFKTEYGYSGQTTHYYDDAFSVLVREGASYQKELLILLDKYTVQVFPTGSSEVVGKVVVNGRNLEFSKESVAQFKYNGDYILVHVYALPNGAVRLLFPQTDFEVIYDGPRVKLQVSNTYRGRVRGLCGTFDGEYVTDFTTPKNCVVQDPTEFAASYAIVDETCQGPARELHQRVLNVPCYKQTVLLGDVISEEEAGRYQPRMRSSHSNLVRLAKQPNEGRCSKLRSKVVEQAGRTCFSLHPQVTCSSKCKATSKIEKRIEFHCIPKTIATKHWVEMIKNGANPDFTQKPANEWFKINTPEQCIPN
uniref:Uncharacterized protein n=1 Tax=Rhodnius prolixus TaxID=13249 RepID=T1IB40_RHOPR